MVMVEVAHQVSYAATSYCHFAEPYTHGDQISGHVIPYALLPLFCLGVMFLVGFLVPTSKEKNGLTVVALLVLRVLSWQDS